MKLYLNDTSPFARLVLATAVELKLTELKLVWIDPWSSPEALLAINPFCTIPVLTLENNQALYESLIICEHLLNRNAHHANIKAPDYSALADMQQLSLAKCLMEFAFRKASMPRFVPDAENSPLYGRISIALERSLKHLENTLTPKPELATQPIGFTDLCLAIALDYTLFRLEESLGTFIGKNTRAWLSAIHERQSLQQTTPAQLKNQPATVAALLNPL